MWLNWAVSKFSYTASVALHHVLETTMKTAFMLELLVFLRVYVSISLNDIRVHLQEVRLSSTSVCLDQLE